MAGINDYSNTAGSNTTINGIDIAEGCSPAGINNAIRQLMADIADMDDGVVPLQTPDINGGTIDGAIIGGTTPAAGTFTNLTATGTLTGLLGNVVEDVTPQLGGDLDLNSNDITGTGNINITGTATVSGDLTVDTNTLYVDSANNEVGIGTTSPSDKLNVYDGAISVDSTSGIFNGTRYQAGSGSANINLYKSRTNTIGDHSALVNEDNISAIISRGSDGTSFIPTTAIFSKVDGSVSTNSIPSALTFSTNGGSSSYTERMRIDSSGRVGIGTSSPDSILHLYSNNSGGTPQSRSALIIEDTESNGDSIQFLSTDTGFQSIFFGDASDNDVGRIAYSHSGDSMRFNTNGSEAMRIDSSGNVGIGTSSPTHEITLSKSATGVSDNPTFQIINTWAGEGNNVGFSNRALAFLEAGNGTVRTRIQTRYDSGANLGEIGTETSHDFRFFTGNVERMRINSSGNVGIGTSSPSKRLHSVVSSSGSLETALALQNANAVDGTETALDFSSNTSFVATARISSARDGSGLHSLRFSTYNLGLSERMRIDSNGTLCVSKTGKNLSSGNGVTIAGDGESHDGQVDITIGNAPALRINRAGSDGGLVDFYQGGNFEGDISVSGATVSYNGFTGTHWSRLSDNSKPTILKGTILESLDEMMDWYQVQFDITETDDEGNETTRTEKQSYALGDGESVGDVITYNYKGIDYQATIIQEGDVKHTKSKISDTVDAKNVYGVFMDWDNDDDTVNDMYVAQTGTFVVRINGSETVSKGDLIQSNGDGTGKVQADDIIRASTVAKVLSTTKIETYEDGSYIVPCSLHC